MNASSNQTSCCRPSHIRLCVWTWVLLFAFTTHNLVAARKGEAQGSAFPSAQPREYLDYNGRYAHAPESAPQPVHRAVEAANQLQSKPYVWGGGHRVLYDRGYDCSGSVSYVLHQAGLLSGPMQSKDFLQFGDKGPGRYITIYVRNGHVFLSILGLRFDTSDVGAGRGDGPRWRPKARTFSGYTMRHPPGL